MSPWHSDEILDALAHATELGALVLPADAALLIREVQARREEVERLRSVLNAAQEYSIAVQLKDEGRSKQAWAWLQGALVKAHVAEESKR